MYILTSSEGIFEDLFKAQELQNRQVDYPKSSAMPFILLTRLNQLTRRMETQPTLVRAQGRVELDAIATVDLQLSQTY